MTNLEQASKILKDAGYSVFYEYPGYIYAESRVYPGWLEAEVSKRRYEIGFANGPLGADITLANGGLSCLECESVTADSSADAIVAACMDLFSPEAHKLWKVSI
jgi:hypothetical protein